MNIISEEKMKYIFALLVILWKYWALVNNTLKSYLYYWPINLSEWHVQQPFENNRFLAYV